MKTVFTGLFAGLLACASVQLAAATEAVTYKEKIVYSFCTAQPCTDGAGPSSLIAVNGLLYGTTSGGGSSTFCNGGCGTVFSLDPATGAETVVYSFCPKKGCNDGANPDALIAVNGMLYGATSSGGQYGGTICPYGCGTVFSLDPSTGVETVLYSFCHDKSGCVDGALPFYLIDVNGVLYGTTGGGGIAGCNGEGCGTVFSLDAGTDVETVLYSFCSQANCADGQWPNAGLLPMKGKLYGTTLYGGPNGGCDIGFACGVVFAIDLKSGAETVPYAFCSQTECADGALPNGNLIDVKGTLYGTTFFGGAVACQNRPPGCGTAFSLDPGTGTETVLHSFGSGNDGFEPGVGMIDVKGTLYGTTDGGGSANAGTAFALNPSTGAETIIWSLCGTNCFFPSGLLNVNGKFYGTLGSGGTGQGGAVFVLKPKR